MLAFLFPSLFLLFWYRRSFLSFVFLSFYFILFYLLSQRSKFVLVLVRSQLAFVSLVHLYYCFLMSFLTPCRFLLYLSHLISHIPLHIWNFTRLFASVLQMVQKTWYFNRFLYVKHSRCQKLPFSSRTKQYRHSYSGFQCFTTLLVICHYCVQLIKFVNLITNFFTILIKSLSYHLIFNYN